MAEIKAKTDSTNHIVLARKWRPQNFTDLKGQDALVRTISGAFALNKVPHAFILSGIRGIGKTTTARIMAKIFNCENLQFTEEKIVKACDSCANCRNFNEQKHPDILEIDAASKTGVDDMREIIETIAYSPLIGRYKVFIIDEVHMLSKSAFNALLKTLEEPPAHVKFVFATTEMQKIPATIISRCQTHILKSFTIEDLTNLMTSITKSENISIDQDALSLIATKGDGSVRDCLSLLEQVSSSSASQIGADDVRQMIGIGSISEICQLFSNILSGDTEKSLLNLAEIHRLGIEPMQIILELQNLVHLTSKTKISENFLKNQFLPENINEQILNFSKKFDITKFSIFWQMLIKSAEEMKFVENRLASVEMTIIRLCFMSKAPSLEELLKKKSENSSDPEQLSQVQANAEIETFNDLVDLCREKGEHILYHNLRHNFQVTFFEIDQVSKTAKMSYQIKDGARINSQLISKLPSMFNQITKLNWQIQVENSPQNAAISTIVENENAEIESQKQQFAEEKPVKEFLNFFKNSQIKEITKLH